MCKWKSGEIVNIDGEKFLVHKTNYIPPDCTDCAFCKTHSTKYPCNECTEGELIPEDCIFLEGF